MKKINGLTTAFFILSTFSLLAVCLYFYPAMYNATRIDSVGHFIGFFILAWVFNGVLKLSLLHTSVCLSLYAVASEIGQYYLGFRNGEFRDVIADMVGVVLFVVLKRLLDLIHLYRNKAAINS